MCRSHVFRAYTNCEHFHIFYVVKCQNCILPSTFAYIRTLPWVPSATQTFKIKLKVHTLQNMCVTFTYMIWSESVIYMMYTPTRINEVNSK